MFISKNNLKVSLQKKEYPNIKFETSLFLHGKTGNGKTYLARQLALEFFNKYDLTGEFITVVDLIQEYQNLYNEKEDLKEKAKQTVSRCKNEMVLILDDIGTEKVSEYSQSQLFDLINYRVENALPIIYTSNLSLEELKLKYNEKIIRRIKDNCEIHFLNKKVQVSIPKFDFSQKNSKEEVEETEVVKNKERTAKLFKSFLSGLKSSNENLAKEVIENKTDRAKHYRQVFIKYI